MKKFITVGLVAFFCSMLCFGQNETATYSFNWAVPPSLTPAYPAPTSSNRYSDYLSGVTFSAGPVRLSFDDTAVADPSQRPCMVYAYIAGAVELRLYPGTVLDISVTEGETIRRISFTGDAASAVQMVCYDSDGTFVDNVWQAPSDIEVTNIAFKVRATVNCSSIAVSTAISAVEDAGCDISVEPAAWYTIQGTPLAHEPTSPGIYLRRQGNKTEKIIRAGSTINVKCRAVNRRGIFFDL